MMAVAPRIVDTPLLSIAYEHHGPEGGRAVVLLHGFPYSPRAYDEVAPALAAAGMRVIVPYLRGYGPTRFRDDATMRSAEQAALGQDLLDLMAALDLDRPILVGYDWGGRAACVAAALAPDRVRALVSCWGYNILGRPSLAPAPPAWEHMLWYQYYLHTHRGRMMLNDNRRGFCRYLWEQWSPTWAFSDETFEESAQYFDNPDFVEIVLHSYRWRAGLVPGDPRYAALALYLEQRPDIAVPTIVLRGDQGISPPMRPGDRERFTSHFTCRTLPGIGHSPPQEAPDTVAQAVLELDEMTA